MLWNLGRKIPMEQRLDMLAAAGYTGAELTNEWRSWSPEEKERIQAKRKATGIRFDLIFPTNIVLTEITDADRFRAELREGIAMAHELGTTQFGFKSGPHTAGMSPEQLRAAIVNGLKLASEAVRGETIDILLEPIDVLEDRKQVVNTAVEAFDIARSIGDPRIKVLYDLYHEQRGAGNVMETLRKNIDLTGLVHIADVPGRHRPGTGEMNYPNIYRELAQLNYRGFLCMEFYPEGDTVQELRAAREEVLRAVAAV